MPIHRGIDLTIYSSFQRKLNAYFTRIHILNKKIFYCSLWKSSGGSSSGVQNMAGEMWALSAHKSFYSSLFTCVWTAAKWSLICWKKTLLTYFSCVSSNDLLDWGRVLLSTILWIISFTYFSPGFLPFAIARMSAGKNYLFSASSTAWFSAMLSLLKDKLQDQSKFLFPWFISSRRWKDVGTMC